MKHHTKKIFASIIIMIFVVIISVGAKSGQNAYYTNMEIKAKELASIHPESDDYNGWILTQYRDYSGQQGVFYTFYNSSQNLFLIIDGGWPQNAEQVRKVIEAHGNHVNGWFISHYHKDHVGAFNDIISNPRGIIIDNIYAPPIDYDYYIEKARAWDEPEYYTIFLEIMNGADNLIYLNKGDTVEFSDLSIDILHSYESKMKEKERKDIHNNASLVLKASLKNDSVLFFSDCHSKWVAKSLLKHYTSDELKATYIQVGHHGTNSLPIDFYDALYSPKAYLFDAPEWLMTSDDYTSKELSNHFIENGVSVIDQRTAPNVIELE